MRRSLKKVGRTLFTLILWAASAFFLLGGMTFFGKSVPAAILMLMLGLLLLPPIWRRIPARTGPRITKIVLATALLITAIAVTPKDTQTTSRASQTASKKPTTSQAQKASSPKVANQKEDISKILYTDTSYMVQGSGAANQNYSLEFSNGTTASIKTDTKGKFKTAIPSSAGVFGSVELTRDTNGFWPGGSQVYKKVYFVLEGKHTQYGSNVPKPVFTNVSSSQVSGYYAPNTTILLKSAGKTLAQAKVNDQGKYTFSGFSVHASYLPISLYEKASTGWFSSKETKLLDGKYLDTGKRQIVSKLPVTTKEVSKTERIAFDSQTVENSSLAKGETKVTQDGADGEKTITYKVTYKGDTETARVKVSEVVNKQPVTKITTVGTYVAPAVTIPSPSTTTTPTQSTVRTGAICRDGWHSSATGRGACSHHGGVSYWLY